MWSHTRTLVTTLHRQGRLIFFKNNNTWNRASTDKILEENLVQSAFQQTLGDRFTFQLDNDLKQGQIYTGVAYQEDIEYFTVLNWLENLWQDLKMAV
jgi:hypothetical protein